MTTIQCPRKSPLSERSLVVERRTGTPLSCWRSSSSFTSPGTSSWIIAVSLHTPHRANERALRTATNSPSRNSRTSLRATVKTPFALNEHVQIYGTSSILFRHLEMDMRITVRGNETVPKSRHDVLEPNPASEWIRRSAIGIGRIPGNSEGSCATLRAMTCFRRIGSRRNCFALLRQRPKFE